MTVTAIVGGYGAVGRAVAEQLHAWGLGPVRIGGRDADRAAALVATDLAGDGSAYRVDTGDPAGLARFCAHADIVVNCAGPAPVVGDRVARAALRAGAHYVDAAGEEDRYTQVRAGWPAHPGRRPTALLSAGMMPGLSGLLPRYAATTVTGARRLVAYIGGRDRFTRTGAADYLDASAGDGHPLAAWRGGRRVPAALDPREFTHLAPFGAAVTALPYLSAETERMARAVGLTEVDWYSVFVGERVLAALRRGGADDPDPAAALCRAADLDVFGHRPYQLLVFEVTGADGTTRTTVVRGSGAGALTGAAAALAVRAVAAGDVPAGVHHAADVLDAVASVAVLRTTSAVLDISVHDGPIETGYDEGEL
jgi:hypothetical protein